MALGVLLLPKLLFISYKKRLFDMPGGRRVHTAPVPRLGGVVFLPIIIMSFLLTLVIWHKAGGGYENAFDSVLRDQFYMFFIGASFLFMVGIADDLVRVSYRSKFLVQLAVASLFPLSGLYVNDLGGLFGIHELPGWVGYALTLVLVVYIINAINLIDGIDGLASILSLVSLTLMGALFFSAGLYPHVLFICSLFGVIAVFFFFNVFGRVEKGQKLFMGDTGSLILGYSISFLFLFLLNKSTLSVNPWENGFAMIAASSLVLPLFDVMRVVMARVRSKRNLFLPDRNHIHHKLIRAGLRPRGAMLVLLLLSVFFITLNVLLVGHASYTLVLLADIAVWIVLNVMINVFIRRREHTYGSIWHIPYDDGLQGKENDC